MTALQSVSGINVMRSVITYDAHGILKIRTDAKGQNKTRRMMKNESKNSPEPGQMQQSKVRYQALSSSVMGNG